MEGKDKQTQAPVPEVKPVVAPVKPVSGPCASQLKDYQECLDSFLSFFTGCKKQQEAFKACPEFGTWLETSVKNKRIQ